jgi:hypothetical protein
MPRKLADGSCPEGSYLDASTGRCRKNTSKKCPEGEVRDPVTKRCRAKSKPGRKKKSPKKSPPKMHSEFDKFKAALKHFHAVRNSLPAKYGADDSECSSALRDHVIETIKELKLSKQRYWGLLNDPDDHEHFSQKKEKAYESANSKLTKAWIPLGMIILNAHFPANFNAETAKISDYLQKTQFLRYD